MSHRTCTYEGCDKPRAKRGWCGTHYERWRVHGDPRITHVRRGNPSYLSMHKQVHRRRGKASDHPCAHCGGQAQQWAYDHSDPNERTELVKVRKRYFHVVYSQDHARYLPLCRACHYRFDHPVATP